MMHVLLAAAAGIAAMTAAMDRGDLDEVARQGALAGPAVVERALASPQRTTQLAAIVAAPAVTDAVELLPALARVATGADRRTAIPAARAALQIATAFGKHERPDDIAADDVDAWRASFEALGRAQGHAAEARVLALETAVALEHAIDTSKLGFDLAVLGDSDVDVALAAAALACAEHKADVVAIFPADKLRALAADHPAARDVERCVK